MPPAHADHRRSAVDRTLPLRTRGDLQSIEVQFGGESNYIVKDPVAEETFHFSAAEHALLEALRQPTSLRDLQRLIETRFAPSRASVGQLQHFLNRLYEQGLLVGENPGQGGQLLKRFHDRDRCDRRSSLLQILSIKLGGFDPRSLIDRLHVAVGWLWSKPGMLIMGALICFATLLAIGAAPELAARMPATAELAQPKYLPIWLAAIISVKVLHELGHATACRHFGARPQEMGVLLLAGAPTLYCDVSDAWRLKSKWQRMAVSSAGMFVELAIAAAAVIVWRYSDSALLSAVCLSLVVVCSVGTLLVNANPLLRYDGYYLLADWLEVPNLAHRARGLVTAAWRRWLLGEPRQDDPLLGPHKRRALWIYALLAKVYMALVLTGLFVLMVKLAKPYHLENAVYTLAAFALFGLLAQPIVAATRLAANPLVRARFRWLRFIAAIGVLAAIIAACLLIPITRRVKAPVMLVPASAQPVFAVTAGELITTATIGAEVQAGDIIAELRNPELDLAVAELEAAVRQRRARLAQLRTLQASLPAALRMIPTAAAELADAEAQLADRRALADTLTIRAPIAGRIVAPPDRPAERRAAGQLRPWTGSPLDEKNLGAWIESGTPLAVIAANDELVAWAGVQQADVPEVEVGQPVRMVADQLPMQIVNGRVISVARRARTNEQLAEGNRQPDHSSLGDGWYHVVEIELDEPAATLLPGARGTVKIATYDSTVGKLVLNELRRTFQRVL
jgi:putative peptide zinc metalloprotease protein